jgi:hypothetical protein
LLGAGCTAAGIAGILSVNSALAWGTLGGWLLAGLLGLSGWWTTRRALAGEHREFLKYLVGGMLGRMLLCGIGAGVVVGTGWLHTSGFVIGLLSGIAVFLGVEIGGLQVAARRLSSAQGDVGRGS